MAVSKLFTPRPMSPERAKETFVEPPDSPEIPVFSGPADKGNPYSPLRLNGDRGSRTPSQSDRKLVIATKPQEKFRY